MKFRAIIIFAIVLFVLAGCGDGEESSLNTAAVEDYEERPAGDWREGKWKFDTLSGDSRHDLYVTEYIQELRYVDKMTFPFGPEESRSIFVGDRIYELDTFVTPSISQEQVQPIYFLSCYDGGTGETWHRQLNVPKLKEYPEQRQILQRMDILDEKEYVLYLSVMDEEGEVVAYVALRMDSDGMTLSATNLYPAMRDNGLEIQDNYGYAKAYTDRQGCFYLLSDFGLTGLGEGEILVIGSDGESVERVGSDDPQASARYVMNDPDGNAVFEIYDAGERQLELWGYRPETGKRLYAQIQMEQGMPMAMSPEGYVYYGTQEGCLYRWDLYTGVRELCIDYGAAGMVPWRVRIGIGDSGEPVLLQESSASPLICLLGTEPGMAVAMESVELLCITPNSYITGSAMDYTLEHADCIIQAESLEYSSTWEEQRSRALADLVAGKGADVYYIPMEDLDMLNEKGALADLTDVLPEEYREAIFPGTLELGTIDGRLMGLCPNARVRTVVADRTLWPQDHWTLQEALELKAGDGGKYNWLICGSIQMAGYGNSLPIYLYSLADSPFLDLDAGTCDFTNPLFVQLLEMIKAEKSGSAAEGQGTIAYEQYMGTFTQFNGRAGAYYNEIRDSDSPSPTGIDALGYPYYLVGFPVERGTGSYWESSGCVVVNKNTEHWEAVKEFLISLYDYDRQRSGDCCARNDLTEGNIKRETSHPIYGDALFYSNGEGWSLVYESPEGDIWLDEYIEFMNSCVPKRRGTSDIEDIVIEETGSFFAGDKDAWTVAELIQNRVQLYLDERDR